jgi:hypothetical protein
MLPAFIKKSLNYNIGLIQNKKSRKELENNTLRLLTWRRRESNPGPNTATVGPSTCLFGLNFRTWEAVRRT